MEKFAQEIDPRIAKQIRDFLYEGRENPHSVANKAALIIQRNASYHLRRRIIQSRTAKGAAK